MNKIKVFLKLFSIFIPFHLIGYYLYHNQELINNIGVILFAYIPFVTLLILLVKTLEMKSYIKKGGYKRKEHYESSIGNLIIIWLLIFFPIINVVYVFYLIFNFEELCNEIIKNNYYKVSDKDEV